MITIELIPKSGAGNSLLDALQNRIVETKAHGSVEITAVLRPINSKDRVRFDLTPDVTKVLATVEAGACSGAAGDGRRLAPSGVQDVLEVAFAPPEVRGQEVCEARAARAHLPHGGRESNVGSAAHAW
jgi:hypothetical protein